MRKICNEDVQNRTKLKNVFCPFPARVEMLSAAVAVIVPKWLFFFSEPDVSPFRKQNRFLALYNQRKARDTRGQRICYGPCKCSTSKGARLRKTEQKIRGQRFVSRRGSLVFNAHIKLALSEDQAHEDTKEDPMVLGPNMTQYGLIWPNMTQYGLIWVNV